MNHYYRIVLVAIIALAVIRIIIRYRRGGLTRRRVIAWLLLWLGVLAAGMVPQWTDSLSKRLGIERGATLFMFLAILFLFYLVFTLFVKIDELQRQLTELIRQQALRCDPRDPAEPPQKQAERQNIR